MRIEEIMTRDVQSCAPDTNLAAVAKMMWDRGWSGSDEVLGLDPLSLSCL